jgi:hypothetical protein
MKTMKLLFLIQLLVLTIFSCSTKEEQLIDNEKLMAAYKDAFQSKPEILSIEIDTTINKSQIFAYFDSALVIEKEKQIKENRLNVDRITKSLQTGDHWYWDRKMNAEEKQKWPKWLEEHKQKIESVMSGGEELDSVKTIRKIVHFKKKASHDSIKYQITFFTVEQRMSEKSGIKYDKWLSVKANESGPSKEKLFPVLREGTTAELSANILNNIPC